MGCKDSLTLYLGDRDHPEFVGYWWTSAYPICTRKIVLVDGQIIQWQSVVNWIYT